MNRLGRTLAAVALVALTGACADHPHHEVVTVGTLRFDVEIADTPDAQERGLGGRSDIPAGTGMLFPFKGKPRQQEVWMAGMKVPIDVAWIRRDKVTGVRTLPPCRKAHQSSCPRWRSPGPADRLLEVRAGLLESTPIGTTVRVTQ